MWRYIALSLIVRLISFVSVRSLCLSCRRSNTRPNAGLLLAHRLRRLAYISPVLAGYRVVFVATLNVGQHHRRRTKINPVFVQSIVPVVQPA